LLQAFFSLQNISNQIIATCTFHHYTDATKKSGCISAHFSCIAVFPWTSHYDGRQEGAYSSSIHDLNIATIDNCRTTYYGQQLLVTYRRKTCVVCRHLSIANSERQGGTSKECTQYIQHHPITADSYRAIFVDHCFVMTRSQTFVSHPPQTLATAVPHFVSFSFQTTNWNRWQTRKEGYYYKKTDRTLSDLTPGCFIESWSTRE
jgi:hypothetical protein